MLIRSAIPEHATSASVRVLHMPGWRPIVRRVTTTLVTVSLMTWVVMPRVTRLLHRWLYPGRRP